MARIYQSERPWTVSHGPGSARRRLERQGPHGGRTDGSRAGGERVAGGRDRHDERRRKRRIQPACRTPTTACAGSNGRPRPGTATRRRSGSTAARAAATWRSCSPCGRTIERYNAIPLPEAPTSTPPWPTWRADRRSAIRSRASRTPRNMKRDAMMQNHYTYFKPWETIHESNPQEILERKEK